MPTINLPASPTLPTLQTSANVVPTFNLAMTQIQIQMQRITATLSYLNTNGVLSIGGLTGDVLLGTNLSTSGGNTINAAGGGGGGSTSGRWWYG